MAGFPLAACCPLHGKLRWQRVGGDVGSGTATQQHACRPAQRHAIAGWPDSLESASPSWRPAPSGQPIGLAYPFSSLCPCSTYQPLSCNAAAMRHPPSFLRQLAPDASCGHLPGTQLAWAQRDNSSASSLASSSACGTAAWWQQSHCAIPCPAIARNQAACPAWPSRASFFVRHCCHGRYLC